MNKEFYSIGRGSLNINGKFYYGLDYQITDFMRNLEQENEQLKQQLQQRDNIISASINKYIKEYEQKIDFEIDMGSQGEYKKIKCYEEFINKLNDLKNILEKSDK